MGQREGRSGGELCFPAGHRTPAAVSPGSPGGRHAAVGAVGTDVGTTILQTRAGPNLMLLTFPILGNGENCTLFITFALQNLPHQIPLFHLKTDYVQKFSILTLNPIPLFTVIIQEIRGKWFLNVVAGAGCYPKIPESRWLGNNKHLFLSVLEAGSPG